MGGNSKPCGEVSHEASVIHQNQLAKLAIYVAKIRFLPKN